MRFLHVPDNTVFAVHLSSVACCLQLFLCCAAVSLRGRSSFQLHICCALTDKTATAVLGQGSSLCVMKTHPGSGTLFVRARRPTLVAEYWRSSLECRHRDSS